MNAKHLLTVAAIALLGATWTLGPTSQSAAQEKSDDSFVPWTSVQWVHERK